MPSIMPNLSVGQRIAAYRKMRGYTQRQLADYAHVSHSLLSKVEAGHRPPSHAFLAAVARALRVTTADLQGQPYDPERRVHTAILAIRDVIRRSDMPADLYTPPRPLADIADDVQHLTRLRRDARYTKLGAELPGVLEELIAAWHTTTGGMREQAARLLATTYYAAHVLAHRLGYPDLRAHLVDRLALAADRTGDPLHVAVAAWARGGLYQSAGDYQAGIRVLDAAADRLRADTPDLVPDAIAVLGSLHLRQVTMASRARDEAMTSTYVQEARRLADALPGSRDRVGYQLTFGPVNVSIHHVAAHVELNQPERAVALADDLGQMPSGLPPTRVGHHYIDLARAYLAVGEPGKAINAVKTARRVAPQQTRYHPMVRETMRVLLTRHHRMTDELRGMVAWLNLRDE